jgi:hypothetical protein
MTTNFANKTSLKVPFQLPEFVRSDENQTFVAFIQAYYEWMEQQNIGSGKEGVIYGTQNLLNYQNIDFVEPGQQFNKFIDYYINDFLPNFPKDALADKSKLVKIARKLYESKGTPASYQFLFRALFNSDAQIFLTRDVVLRASDGKWYVSKSLRLGTNDEQFLSINNLRIFGLTSKSFATVDRSVRVGNRIEVYISNIERLFVSGEDVVVVDNNNQTLYFKDGVIVPKETSGATKLQAKILGTISSVQINPAKRGQLYKGRDSLYPGDPVVFYGGLNDVNDIGATAYVYETTSGSLRDISVINGSYGYREDPNTVIQFVGGGGSGAIANVTTVDVAGQINVAFIPKDSITLSQLTRIGNTVSNMIQLNIRDYFANSTIITGNVVSTSGVATGDTITIVGSNNELKLDGSYTVTVANANYFFITNTNGTPTGTWSGLQNVGLTAKGEFTDYAFFPANTTADLKSSLANAFYFDAFSTYPIGSVVLNNGGGGYVSLPTVSAKSLYGGTSPFQKNSLSELGILGPITINTPGIGYANGDIINFENSAGGVGANAVVSVNATGSIISATYTYANTDSIIKYPLGGLGYKQQSLPTLSVASSGGAGAVLTVNTVLGDGATFLPVSDERGIGAITSFIIENFGEDYISAPSVSLRVRDLVVSNVSLSTLPKKGDVVYQGTDLATSVFKANVDSIFLLEPGPTTETSKYVLRTYNYTSNTKTNLQLTIDRTPSANIYLDLDVTYNIANVSTGEVIYQSGIRTYGNGAAQATAKFLNGLIVGEGRYINDDGFLSSNQVLEDENYNNYTYDLTVQASFAAYKDILYKLLHPSGTKVVPFNALKSQKQINIHRESFQSNSYTLGHYTGDAGSNAAMFTTFERPSNNIIHFGSLVGANIAQIINVGSIISISQYQGPNVYSDIISVDYTTDNAVIRSNVFTSFANVALANVTTSNDRINITSFTGQYDLINNGEYSNTENKLRDIAFIGDRIRVVSGTNVFHGTITYVSYPNNVIFANSTLGFTATDAKVSIARDIVSTDVVIYNTLGTVFYPELLTQDGKNIITQDGRTLILG